MNPQPIKALREELGLTQEEFSEKIGITRQLLNHIENGYRDISRSTEDKLKTLLNGIPMPAGFSAKYARGQRFSKALGALSTYGITLEHLRDIEFKVKGSQLSSMYLGLIEIPKSVKTTLVGKYNVNWKFIENGELPILNRTPDTISSRINRRIPPVYSGNNTNSALDSILENDFSDWQNGEFLFEQVRGIIKIDSDSMSPLIEKGDFVAISLQELDNIENNQILILRTNEKKEFLGRLSKSKSSTIKIKFDNTNYNPIEILAEEVSFVFPIKSIIKNIESTCG